MAPLRIQWAGACLFVCAFTAYMTLTLWYCGWWDDDLWAHSARTKEPATFDPWAVTCALLLFACSHGAPRWLAPSQRRARTYVSFEQASGYRASPPAISTVLNAAEMEGAEVAQRRRALSASLALCLGIMLLAFFQWPVCTYGMYPAVEDPATAIAFHVFACLAALSHWPRAVRGRSVSEHGPPTARLRRAPSDSSPATKKGSVTESVPSQTRKSSQRNSFAKTHEEYPSATTTWRTSVLAVVCISAWSGCAMNARTQVHYTRSSTVLLGSFAGSKSAA